MYFSYVRIENWENFKSDDLHFGRRLFLIGPHYTPDRKRFASAIWNVDTTSAIARSLSRCVASLRELRDDSKELDQYDFRAA